MTYNDPFQIFAMCINVTYTVEEYIQNGEESGDEEYRKQIKDDMKDEPLSFPVTNIQFLYPYDEIQRIRLGRSVNTKRDLLDRIHDHLPKYLEEHPYTAPHDITDFVIEQILLPTCDKRRKIASIYLGS